MSRRNSSGRDHDPRRRHIPRCVRTPLGRSSDQRINASDCMVIWTGKENIISSACRVHKLNAVISGKGRHLLTSARQTATRLEVLVNCVLILSILRIGLALALLTFLLSPTFSFPLQCRSHSLFREAGIVICVELMPISQEAYMGDTSSQYSVPSQVGVVSPTCGSATTSEYPGKPHAYQSAYEAAERCSQSY